MVRGLFYLYLYIYSTVESQKTFEFIEASQASTRKLFLFIFTDVGKQVIDNKLYDHLT